MTETWSPDRDLIDIVHDHGLAYWASVACFSDHAEPIRTTRPELTPITAAGTPREQQEWYVGLIPTDDAYNADVLRRCADMSHRYEIDGIALDFLRWPLHWELELRPGAVPIDSSFDETTLQKYRSFDPEFPGELVGADAAAHILRERLETWVSFKCQTITSLAEEICTVVASQRPTIGTAIFLVPGDDRTRRRYVGQDVGALGAIFDELLPMTYHRIVGREPGWVGDTVRETRSLAPRARVTPAVQVTADPEFAGSADWGASMSDTDARDSLRTGISASAGDGIVVFPGEALLRGSSADRIRSAVRAVAAP